MTWRNLPALAGGLMSFGKKSAAGAQPDADILASVGTDRLSRIMRTASFRPYPPSEAQRRAARAAAAHPAPIPVAAPRPIQIKPAPSEVTETVSVVLRRQIPVRDDASRSWIGGLPMMPKDIEWPVGQTTEYPGRGETPLHFVAQICCADLPTELWGGLGPRTGWLLLFLNGQDWDVMDNPDATRVLHIAELGPEREPPPGIYPVHDETYTGPNYNFVRSQEDIPAVWRRWPVDIVTISNTPAPGRKTPIPDNFAALLYEGQEVRGGVARPPVQAPFSWRGALYVADSIARALARDYRPPSADFQETLGDPNWRHRTLAALDAELTRLDSTSPRMTEDTDAESRERLARARALRLKRARELDAARRLIADSADGASLIEQIRESQRAYAQWRHDAGIRIEAIREAILGHPLDAELSAQDWQALADELSRDRQSYWLARSDNDHGVLPALIDHSLLDLAVDGLNAAQVELAADYYVSRDERRLIPDRLVAFMEPHWRALYSNRPHRMGGLHDGIQSDPVEGPVKSVLLFQIATDDAMHWVWGDAGAYYVFIDVKKLAAGDFSTVEALFENH